MGATDGPMASCSWQNKTAYAALVLCLNIDVDPPDVVKTNPCAVLECWVDPHTMPSHKALEVIGTNLQHQFEGLNPKIPYKPILDPSYEDLKRFCLTLRKQAMDDAVLFYYNGHGVPKPTPSGSTKLDAFSNFTKFAKQRDHDMQLKGGYPEGVQPFSDCIQLAACAADEQLPSCPELPADLFTSCLTSPIDIALRYYVLSNDLPHNISIDMVMQLPGDLKDRRTPLGELNWIFTAITDTIAWTTFPRELFTRLYRSDLLIASLFRNFLLAERIMKNYHCTPHTSPPLPSTNTHPLWASWDLAVDACLRQLPEMLKHSEPSTHKDVSLGARSRRQGNRTEAQSTPNGPSGPSSEKSYAYVPSRFFTDQLTAFEVWISRGGSALTKPGPLALPLAIEQTNSLDTESSTGQSQTDGDKNNEHHLVPRKPPDQLPIVLQVLLSQPHRLRALILLSQFVDLGPWAVHLALTIGIFPYIARLLQAAGQDLKPVLIFIWARIFAVDPTCQVDLYNNQGYKYFATALGVQDDPRQALIPNSSEHRAMCASILSAIARDYVHGQNACWRERVFDSCFERLDEGDFLLRQWSALCIAQIWDANDEIKVYGVDRGTQDKLIALLSDDSPEVRSAALYALGTFLGASGASNLSKLGGGGSGTMHQLEERIHFRMEVAVVTGAALAIKEDASPMVRKELLVLISCLVKEWRGYFIVCAWIYWEEDRRWKKADDVQHHDEDIAGQAVAEWLDGFGDDGEFREENRVLLSSFFTIFSILLELSVDPYQEVATNAQTVVDYIMALLLESPFTRLDSTTLSFPPPSSADTKALLNGTRSRAPSLGSSQVHAQSPSSAPPRPGLMRNDTMTSTIQNGVTSTLRRTSSFATALKNLAGNIAFPTMEDGRSSPKPPSTSASRTDVAEVSRPPSPNLNYAQYTSPYSRPGSPSDDFSVQSPSSPLPPVLHTSEPHHPPMDFLPSDVMEALMEEDMERLRARRRTATAAHARPHHSHHHRDIPTGMASPSGSTFSMDSSIILGLGTGVGIRDVLPLKSRFYDWCCEYFKEPQMRQPEADEPGSVQYNYQVWRQQRNEQVIGETQRQAEVAQLCRWDRPVTTIQVNGLPLSMAFHAYDPHLVVANETDMITVWDWIRRKRLNRFFNGNPRGTSINSLHIINQDVGGIILTAAADGIVRLYRNYDPNLSCNSPVQMRVVTDWKQSGGTLLVGGDSRIIRVWDAHTESQVMDLDTDSESPITSMISDEGSSSTFLASFADGVIKVFDRRLEEDDAVVRSYSHHTSWVQNVKWHPNYGGQFMSASLDGEVKLWDIRGGESPLKTWDLFSQGLSAFDVHPQTDVFVATSSLSPSNWRSQRTVVHSLTGSTPLCTLTSGLTAPPPRDPAISFTPRSSSAAFHPREMVYGIVFLGWYHSACTIFVPQSLDRIDFTCTFTAYSYLMLLYTQNVLFRIPVRLDMKRRGPLEIATQLSPPISTPPLCHRFCHRKRSPATSSRSEMVRAHMKQTPEEKKETHKKKSTSKKKTETGSWPCKIDGCNKVFAREADLKRHQRTTKTHSQPGFACPQCDATFTRTDALRRHQKSRHNGVVIEPSEQDKIKTTDDDPDSSGSKSPSPAGTPTRSVSDGNAKSTPSALAQPTTSGPASGPSSYYRQHTMNGYTHPPRPLPGMLIDPHYPPPPIGLPTSATRLHQANWHPPPPPWGAEALYMPPYYPPSPYYRHPGP
ncbi:WD repeat-containing protein mip1 [Grifola frondosa]|uniref:WD repeat-containing protein mip1 n=1 Tax=Grifola frondosa TaxID=5627 RepID=A0A1C7LX22_GRIFR|nr:WD repeat-containing protein mip1 [Grifola frondosa]